MATDKANNAYYPNNPVENKPPYSNKENELLAHNRKLQEELDHLKQALAAQAAPLKHMNDADPATAASKREVTPGSIAAAANESAERLLKENKLAGMKDKLAVAKVQLEKEEAEQKAKKLEKAKEKALALTKKLLEGEQPVKKKK